MSTANDMRRQSYEKTMKDVVGVSRAVFEAVLQHGPVTAWKLVGVLQRQVYTIRPRLTELIGMGLIKESGTEWHEGTQRNVTRYEAVDKQLGLFLPS